MTSDNVLRHRSACGIHCRRSSYLRGGVAVGAIASPSVESGSIFMFSHTIDFKSAIHRSSAWRSAIVGTMKYTGWSKSR